MRIHVKTEELKNAVACVTPALASKAEVSYTRAYEFIYVNADDNYLTLKCCNLSIQIETHIDAVVDEAGIMLLPGKLFSDIIRTLPSDETLLESANDAIRIVSGSVDMVLQTVPSNEFTGMFSANADTSVRVNQGQLRKMILQTSPLALQDNSRPILNGVLVEVSGSTLIAVALDGMKFAKRQISIENVDNCDTQVIIPAKLIDVAARVLSDTTDTAVVSFTKQNIKIETGNTTIITRTMEGEFINYRSMIPKDHDTQVRVNRKTLLALFERAYLVAKDEYHNYIQLSYSCDTLTVSVNNEVGKMKDMIPVELNGSDILIAFNAKFLVDIFKTIEEDEILIEMNVKLAPCVLKPVTGESFYYLILPIKPVG